MKNDLSDFIMGISLFSDLQASELQYLIQDLAFVDLQKHTFIYSAGEDAKQVFFLKSGCVKISTYFSDGKEVIKSIIYPNTMFGELCLLGEDKRLNDAQAMDSNVVCCAIPVTRINCLAQQNLAINSKIHKIFSQKLICVEQKLASLVIKDARTRIIDFLKENAEKNGEQVGINTLIQHSLTQQDIANITGTSRQTVTSVFNDLKKSNVINFSRKSILIQDAPRLYQ